MTFLLYFAQVLLNLFARKLMAITQFLANKSQKKEIWSKVEYGLVGQNYLGKLHLQKYIG